MRLSYVVFALGCSGATLDQGSEPVLRLQHCIDVSGQIGSSFDYPVAFDTGLTNSRAGDRIAITDIHGTRPDFGAGGTYVVKGEYTLASADEADIGFHTTATAAGQGCTRGGHARAHQHVTRGSGTFEVVNVIPYVGYPHVSFYIGGEGSGGVYFGKGDFLQR